ncbi:VOC family protein [Acidocella facilis]|uniref:VOC family protein n=1 Tax=Acidocella facilis TaxID=525 RepID=UPI001FD5BFFF|nr:VOC family protein [Acidocella facilis]
MLPLNLHATVPPNAGGAHGELAKLVPELVVSDLQASLRFWRDLIGFSVAYDRPEDGFAYLDLDGAQVMLEQRDPGERQWVTGPLEAPLGRGINFQIEVPALRPILGRLAGADWPLSWCLRRHGTAPARSRSASASSW